MTLVWCGAIPKGGRQMKYNKSRVYTALNADELEVGSKVCVAKDMHALKDAVLTDTIFTLARIASEDYQDRFIAEWTDFNKHPHKNSFTLAYFVEPPKKQMATCRELACWLAHDNGQCMDTRHTDIVFTGFAYHLKEDNNPVPAHMKVRRWGDDEWHEATKEYLVGVRYKEYLRGGK